MGRKPNNFDETQNMFDQAKYEKLLSETNEYIKVKPIDVEKTIHLITKIQGDRGIMDFASAIGTVSRIQLFRIYKKRNIELRDTTIAGIISAQLPESNVSLDAFMEAQGKIRKDKLDEYKKIRNIELRQILEYSLILAGYEINTKEENKTKRSEENDHSKFSVRIHQQSQKEYTWNFEIRSFPFTGKKTDYSSDINMLLSHLVTVSVQDRDVNRFSIIIDNELVYRELKEKAKTIRLPNEVSIILISTIHRKVIEEYVIPLSREKKINNLLPEPVIPARVTMDYSLEEKYKIDSCSIILDDLLENGYTIRHANSKKKVSLFSFINLHPDYSIYVTGDDSKSVPRTFFIKNVSDYLNYSLISPSIHDWLLQTIAYFYTGRFGDRDKISLVVDNSKIYKKISDEFMSSHISNQISVILVDTDKRRITGENSV